MHTRRGGGRPLLVLITHTDTLRLTLHGETHTYIHTQDAHGRAYAGIADAFTRICAEEGPATLLSGMGPRVMWIGIGGFVFFGVYEDCRRLLTTRVGV